MIKEEWLDEPDRIEFQYKGFDCLIQRNNIRPDHNPDDYLGNLLRPDYNPDDYLGNLCGYVALPSTHPYHSKEYSDIDVEVHGGLTYTGECQGHICHTPAEGKPDNVWWLGFDCAHSGDLVPGIHELRKPGGILYDLYKDEEKDFAKIFPNSPFLKCNETYKNIDYVTNEIKQLVDQLEKVTHENIGSDR